MQGNVAFIALMAASAAAYGFAAQQTASPGKSPAVVWSGLRVSAYREADTLSEFVARYAVDDNGGKVPALSTKALPAWAATQAEILAVYGSSESGAASRAKTILQSATRSWEYRVNPLIVGKRYDDVLPDTVVIEIRNAPQDINFVGFTKAGKAVYRPLVDEAATPQVSQDEPSRMSVTTWRNMNATMTDLDGLRSLLLDEALRSGPAAAIPAFDSKRIPKWASSEAALTANGRSAERAHGAWVCVQKLKSRAWTYRVPAAVVGKAFDSLPPTTKLIELVNAPSRQDTPWIGMTLDGRKLPWTTAP